MLDPDGYLSDQDLRIDGDRPDLDVRLGLALTECHMRKDHDSTLRYGDILAIADRWTSPHDDDFTGQLLDLLRIPRNRRPPIHPQHREEP